MPDFLRAIQEQEESDRTIRWLLALMVRRAGGHAYFKWDRFGDRPPSLRWWNDPDGTIHLETPMERE